ncbi:MAG: HAMP domain-containing histidine kinase [Cyclobacteriaceae bacterium]|nr:HAMP domain-containing histidine kinase [Cyclobacteriaceae bacterium]
MAKESKNLPNKSLDLIKRRSTINLVVVSIAFAIALASVYFTRIIVEQLKVRELGIIQLYAKSLEFTVNNQNSPDELAFVVQEIMYPNNSIPVIQTNGIGQVQGTRNIEIDPSLDVDEKEEYLKEVLEEMKLEYEPIEIPFRDDQGEVFDYQYIYYKNSVLLNRLEYYPHVQLSVIAIFGIIAYIAFSYSKSAEQNRVWIGLAKETAHQLGTPISSLMAWVEYFKEDEYLNNKEIIGELEKDIQRLEMITARFSNIGSVPVLNYENVAASVEETISYLKKRVSKKVEINLISKPSDIRARINKPLFDWVIENICKNAVDSMGGVGKIDINIKKAFDDKVIIDISDTGKGIQKSKIKDVFLPGYTTKTRGWGLGLTLVKRIIEKNHEGKIFVRNTGINEGTTFRILLKK